MKNIRVEAMDSIKSTVPNELYKEFNSSDYERLVSIKPNSNSHESLLIWAKYHLSIQSTKIFNRLLFDQQTNSLINSLRIMSCYSQLQTKKSTSTIVATKVILYLLAAF